MDKKKTKSSMTLIGKRRHYITIQAPTRTSDNQGGWVTTWADSDSDWVRAVFLSGSRVLDAGGVQYKRAVEFTMRDRTITEANRIVFEGENYSIYSILHSEKLDDLTILAYA